MVGIRKEKGEHKPALAAGGGEGRVSSEEGEEDDTKCPHRRRTLAVRFEAAHLCAISDGLAQIGGCTRRWL